MEQYTPGVVYVNIVKMLSDYRAVKIKTPMLSQEELSAKLNHLEFVVVEGERAVSPSDPRPAAKVVVVLLNIGSDYSAKLQSFKKITDNLHLGAGTRNMELMFVSENPMTTYIKNHINSLRDMNPTMFIEEHDYAMFNCEKPMTRSAPRVTLMTESDVRALCDTEYLVREKFPKILQVDPIAVWYGMRAGMCAQVVRLSETAGEAVTYMVCVRGEFTPMKKKKNKK